MSLINFLDSRLTMDDGIAEAVETLEPENLSKLSNDKINIGQQV